MTKPNSQPESSAARIRAAVFTMVSEGRLSAADAKPLLAQAGLAVETDRLPIAVIGMAGRFGDCDDLDAYWDMIATGGHCIRTIPAGRWQEGGENAVGGFLQQPELFDPLFFKIAPSEAGLMDPQQRLFLETAWLALEDAALSERELSGTACGVFVGAGAGDYGRRLEAAGVGDAPLALMGNVASILAARIAYLLDLKGPALAVDTACSSSLVAVHLACEALRRGECDSAIAGGVCVINSGRFIAAMSQAGMISRSGRCHVFDSRADGFVCGEGAGAVVLKRLDKALADGNVIHGVILGDGMNQDGRTNGITAPSAPAQEALQRSVHKRFGIDPASIGYIETHGTGTPLGDPIEVEALARAFGDSPANLPKVALGSVKANIGHTLTAAGIAGLLKVLLMLRAGRIPPSSDFQEANTRLGLAETPFRIARYDEPWTPAVGGRRIAAVSSFGFSGTNAHIIVTEAPSLPARNPPQSPVCLLLSGRDAESLQHRAGTLAAYWRRHPELRLDDFAWTLAVGKTPLPHRLALKAASQEQALALLEQLADGGSPQMQGFSTAIQHWLAGGNPELVAEFNEPKPRRVSLPAVPLQRVVCAPLMNSLDTGRMAIAAVSVHSASAFSWERGHLGRNSGGRDARAPSEGERLLPTGSSQNNSLDVLAQVRQETAALRTRLDPALFSNGEAFALVEDWARKAACAALVAAGILSGTRRVITRAALARDFGVVAKCRGLFDALLPIMERCGLLAIEGDLLRLRATPAGLDEATILREQAELRRVHPATAPFLDLLQLSTASLPDVLRGSKQGSLVLFPQGRLDLVGAIYKGNLLADHFNQLMAAAVAALVRHRLNFTRGPLNILEIGAGTGGATAAILEALRPFNSQIRYTYTDVSLGFLKHGRDAFGAAVELALFDATLPGEPQGFATGGFHIMVAANVLHAVPDLGVSLGHLWRLLAPDGVLVLNEVTAVQDFATLTFGLTEGWWAFRDAHRRLPGAPLADPERWRLALAEAGFPEMLALGLSEEGPQAQAILLAGRDARTVAASPVGIRTSLPHTPIKTSGTITPTSQDTLEEAIREEAGQTLGMAACAIDPLGRFMDYGVDSILGLDLVNRLNRRYALNLSPTVVFELPTVRDLARHLALEHGVSSAKTSAPATAQVTEPRLSAQDGRADEPIAVIGMAGRFADADNLDAFHALLAEGRSGIVAARERLGIDPDHPPEHLRSAAPYLRWGGLLKNIDWFDPMFFRISGREAELTDPQHRLFLTEVWRALEDGGYAGSAMEGADCGIFVGCHGGDYTHLMAEKGVVPDAFAFTGNAASILAARIAYLMDLKGPALAVDTACSSSLVAVHLACQALRAGECEMAIAGGVFINTTVGFNTAAASAGMLSPRGRCAAFDADADGFVPGEGCGAVLLKPLSKAWADGDCVIAVIAGSATNQDGKTNGITAPNAASQAALIRKALRRAAVHPAEISYIETHGTGTRLGDPIEIEGLTRGFAAAELTQGSCLLGSVKSNVGHAAHAAGIAGLIKTLLSFRYGELYPSLHFHTANPVLRLEHTPFAVNTQYRPWPKPQGGRRVAGVSSFGFSGTNCHIVLTDPPETAAAVDAPAPVALVALSARSLKALECRRLDLSLWLEAHGEARLADIAFTLGVGRSHFEHRWVAIVCNLAELRAALTQTETNSGTGLPASRGADLQAAAQLYLAGKLPDFAALHPGGCRIPLPTYPFEERSYWLSPPQPSTPCETPLTTLALPTLLAPVWEPCPAVPLVSLPTRIGLAGNPARVAALADAFRSLGVETLTVADLRSPLPVDTAALFLFTQPGGDSATVLRPFFDALRAMLVHAERKIPLFHVHDGSPLAAAAIASGPSLRFIADPGLLHSLALPMTLAAPDAARCLLAELLAREAEASINSQGERLIRRLRRIELAPAKLPESGGVWLISGGLGGLGPRLARHFGINRGARIGLLGRSPLQGEKAAELAALRTAGVQVHYVQTDVADTLALSLAIAEIETVLGPISGVIHAAGVPSLTGLAESHWDDMTKTFAGKLDGALALDRVLAGRPLRAFLLFSSIAAELGDFGQCDYAVANAFLGRFAAWRAAEVKAGLRQGRTVALAWPLWEAGHAALGKEGSELIGKALGIQALAWESAMAILDLALTAADTPAEILIMTGNNNDIARLVGDAAGTTTIPHCSNPVEIERNLGFVGQFNQAGSAATQQLARLAMTGEGVSASNALDTHRGELAGMIGRLLKLNPAELKPSASLGDFGFDSIALKEFADLLSKRYAVAISPAVFFAHGSIDALAAYLRDTYPQALQGKPQCPVQAEPPTLPIAEPPAACPPVSHGAVAVIGMAGRFPGADDADGFWQLIESGSITVGAMPDSRRQLLGLDPNMPPVMGGFIDDIEYFDAAFFRMSRREAVHLDPQHRLALTASWNALEDAGINPATLAGRPVGVFFGQQVSGYAALLGDASPAAIAQMALGNVNAMLPNRISYQLDLRGPSEAVDTACSSALVAVHRAVRALRSGECELALAGASSLLLDIKDVQSTQSLGVLSPDGRCHSFDARANGYVKGEGIGVLVLKPLQSALADGDPIHAVIRGSAVNHGGRAQSLTAPNSLAQRDLIRAALADAGVTAASIGYLETHGTGTELGDLVEIEALKEVFAGLAPASLALGAVKANIGHLEPASGMAGLFKVILALRHRILPPLAGLQTLNPYLDLADAPLYLPQASAVWPLPAHGGPRLAAVSAFGFGGANAHAIVEEAPPATDRHSVETLSLLILSAPEIALLAPYARRLARHIERHESLALSDVAHTLMCGRMALPARAAFTALHRAAAIQILDALAEHIEKGVAKPTDLLLGQAGEDGELAFLGAEAEDREFFTRLAAAGQFRRLARFWMAGASVDWLQTFAGLPGQQGRRVHLPGLALRKNTCWVDTGQAVNNLDGLHPNPPLWGNAVELATEVGRNKPAQAGVSGKLVGQMPETVASRPYSGLRQILHATALPSLADVTILVDPANEAQAASSATSALPLSAVTEQIRDIIASALYVSSADLDDHSRFMDLGLDSILAVEVTRAINLAFDLQIQATRLYDYASVADLAGYVCDSLGPSSAVVPNPVQSPSPAVRPIADPVLDFLRERVALALGTDSGLIDPQAPLHRLAIGPEQAAHILTEIERCFACRLEASELGACRDLSAVADLLRRCGSTAIPVLDKSNDAGRRTRPESSMGVSPPPLAAINPRPNQDGSVAKQSSTRLTQMREELAALLLVPPESLETNVPLADLGLDRVSAEELAERFRRSFGMDAPDAHTLLAAASLQALAERLPPTTPPTGFAPLASLSPQAEEVSKKPLSPEGRGVGERGLTALQYGSELNSTVVAPAALRVPASLASGTATVDVAVVGIACRYPGAADKDAFWNLLQEGRSGITRVPAERWNPADHLAGLARPEQREAVQWGGFVEGVDRFDPLFFNLSPREAELMDPQQRLFLEEAWHVFEDAGLSDRRLKGARCGIFIGAGQGDYSRHLPMDDPAQVTGQLLLGNTASILVSRIAYLLDLHGPAVALDSACSSALVAADMGFRAIRDGSCDLALVGGVNLMTTPQMHVMTAASGMLAADGHCRTFDDAASGFVPGEGIGLLVLRRLDHAQADGDRIYGLLRAAGTNQDGKTSGITAPSSTSQEMLELDVWRRFGVDPADFGYIEAHGTGTRLGDPIEIDALTRAFAAYTQRRQDCPIGSVKTNIGHTLASAGAAGLIKTLLALYHGVIPPSLNFNTPNRHIDFSQTPFFVPTSALLWRERRLAAVSSFGFSGTNAHIVLAAAPAAQAKIASARPPGTLLFVLSARDHTGLHRQASRLAAFLRSPGHALNPLDIAHTLALRRSHLEHRLAVCSDSIDGLADALQAFCAGCPDSRLIGPAKRRREPAIFASSLIPQASAQAEALIEIGKLWTEGTEIPWDALLGMGGFVDLPNTVFAGMRCGMRCWIGAVGEVQTLRNLSQPHQQAGLMVGNHSNERAGGVLNLTAAMPVMANHRVHGMPILPGMASLALLHGEARRLGYHGPLLAVSWRTPVMAPALLSLRAEEGAQEVSLQLLDAEQRVVARAQARRIAKPAPLAVDLAAVRADCPTQVAPETIYRRLETGGVEHGMGFRLLQTVQIGSGQILARLRPADAQAFAPISDAGLPPALLDSALQALGALECHAQSGPALLPAGIRRVAVYAPLDRPVLAWLSVDRVASGADRLLADLRLLDEQGEVLAELLGFEARPAHPSTPLGPREDTQSLSSRSDDVTGKPQAAMTASPAQADAKLLIMRPFWQPDTPPTGPFCASPLVLHGQAEAEWAARLVVEQGGESLRIDSLTPKDLAECIAALSGTRPLLFAAWQGPQAPPLDADTLAEAERRGVHALRGVFQGLARRGGAGRLLVVTRGVQDVLPDDLIDPAFAALPGFARAAARELPGLALSCVDLPSMPQTVDADKLERGWLLRETPGELLAYRKRMRLRLRMARILPNLPCPQTAPWPRGMVCLLLGGAGGLGRVMSLRLAAICNAKIAWVGRRPRDAAIESALAEVGQAGGEAIYLQADITEPSAIKRAVATVRERFGHIALAWHGAIVLRDKSVRDLGAEDLDAALAPKSHGLLNLLAALADDPPDWLCLGSSANSFTVNPGQANYAAACTFVDALALAQARNLGWRVRVLNWGIWGETGIVAEERYLQRARQAGVEPLATQEALDVFEWSLATPLPQAIAMKISANALAEIKAELAETASLGGVASALDLAAGQAALRGAFAHLPLERLRIQAEELSALIHYGRERLFRIYAELGLNQHTPAPAQAIALALGIVPERHGLFLAHLEILARCGWVRFSELGQDGEPIVESTGLLPTDPPRFAAAPGGAARLLEAALTGTADVLSGRRPATDVLFPGGRNDLMEAVYRDDPAVDLFNRVLGETVAALAAGKSLRVIEIGAGTGGASGMVLEYLDRYAPGSAYVYTDISPHFAAAGEARFGKRPDTEFRVLDIGRHPCAQGLAPGSFDLLIAANVFHALPDMLDVLGHAKALLKPNGVGLLLEATAPSDFATFVFGLTDGWWAFADAGLRLPKSPLLSVDGWKVAMASRGLRLEGIGQMPGSDAQSILLMVSDGWLPEPAEGCEGRGGAGTHPDLTVAHTKPSPDYAPKHPAMLETAKRLLCQVLRLAPADVDPDEPLERYGVDSLVVNDIHARMEAELGKFSRNIVFEAVTLRGLAQRLESSLATAVSSKPVDEIVAVQDDAVAVIGIAGRFPDADSIEEFWDNLERGHVAIGQMPAQRRSLWPSQQTYPGGYLADVAGFDSLFFNIAPNEAAAMDPQERLFLETAWASLENAGRLPGSWNGRVGVFVGVMGRDYLRLGAESRSLGDAPAWSVANRVSHVLNLNGPSMAVDTACSSALTALHLACDSLRQGDCDAALAGSVHLILHPASREGLQALGMLSAKGTARPFSRDADGLVGGEGVCCLVLRRLSDATAAGDRILGTIRATGLAANGRTRNYMAPSAEGQAEGLRRFLAQRHIAGLAYVECQAVGSPTGDAIEVTGLAQALPPTAGPVFIGSVEGAIGHLEAASGSAQIAKILGMLSRGRLLPTLGVGELHPEVAAVLEDRLQIVRTARPWPGGDATPRLALVQSFGAGGGSAFAVIEEAQGMPAAADTHSLQAVPLSARTATALRRMAHNLLEYLRKRGNDTAIQSIAWTLQHGRTAFNQRLVVLTLDIGGLGTALTHFLAGRQGAWLHGERRGGANDNGKGPATHDPEAVASYWVEGHTVDWDVLWKDAQPPVPIDLPGYPFEHRHCWMANQTATAHPVARTLYGMNTAQAMRHVAPPIPEDDPKAILAPPHLPKERKLVLIEGPGEPEDLRILAEAIKLPAAAEVLIEVRACGLNFADLLCVRGLHPNLRAYPCLPGFEVAGIVAAVGEGVRNLRPGQTVVALSGGHGGFSSHVTVPEYWVAPIPASMDPDLAAATPIGYLTMAHALERAQLCAGETILIQSAAGGIGPFAVQLALARNATVIATAGSSAKLEALRRLGVQHTINYRAEDFAEKARLITGGRGVDVVLNTLGGDAIQKGINLLAPGGRYCEIALTGLLTAGLIDLSRMTENQHIIAINLGHLLLEPEAARRALAEMAEALAAGLVRPLLSNVFGMDRLADAFRLMDRRENIGKIILKPDVDIAVTASRLPTAATDLPTDFCGGLKEIAASILGLSAAEIQADQPLDTYGLNSVSAVALMREVHRLFGIAAPVNLVYEAGSLAALAARLAAEPGTSPAAETGVGRILNRPGNMAYDPIVPIQSGSGRPSFWLHGAPGDASWVTRLAEALQGDAPIYGIEARGVNGRDAPRRSVAALARDYVSALRRVQPDGPYRLGAYSGGGVIAYEMARQLLSSGEGIDKLVLLDAYAPGNPALRAMGGAYGEGFIYQLSVNWFGRRWGLTQLLGQSALEGLNPAAQLQAALDHLYQYARPDVERTRLAAYLQGMDRVGRVLGNALQAYVAKPLEAEFDTLLIRCTAGMSRPDNPYGLPTLLAEADYTDGWQNLLGRPLLLKTVDCDHFSLLDDPWVGQAAAAINRFIHGGEALPVLNSDETSPSLQVRKVVEEEVRRVLMLELPGGIPAQASLAELGAHSVDRAELAAAAMERLDVAVPLTELAGVANIDGLIAVLTLHMRRSNDSYNLGNRPGT